jgi:hypothetical protein
MMRGEAQEPTRPAGWGRVPLPRDRRFLKGYLLHHAEIVRGNRLAETVAQARETNGELHAQYRYRPEAIPCD